MGKDKPKPKPKSQAKTRLGLAAQLKHAPKKTNPFEIKKTKSNFDTMGRRTKGAQSNVIKARQEAITKRKKTLLVEYKSLRKANSFVDRRFGEENGRVTDGEDGAFSRQRVNAAAAGGSGRKNLGRAKFSLSEEQLDDDETLTHLGKALSQVKDFQERPDEDEVDDDVAEQVSQQYNFGGGGEDSTALGPDGRPKTRKQVMEEIIAKSKAYKAARMKQKEDDEIQTDKLDVAYRALVRGQSFGAMVKPVGFTKDNKTKADVAEDAKYDVAARELAFEAKGQAGDRTLTVEELESKEIDRLQKLEKERVRRMRGDPAAPRTAGGNAGGDDDDQTAGASIGGVVATGGFAAKRQKAAATAAATASASGDALGDDFEGGSESEEEDGSEGEDEDDDEGDEDEEVEEPRSRSGKNKKGQSGMTDLDQRRQDRASGNDPLQDSFRAEAAKLLAKYGVASAKPSRKQQQSESEDEDGEGDEGESQEGEEGESQDGSEEGSEEGESGSDEEEQAEEEQPHPSKKAKTSTPAQPKAAPSASTVSVDPVAVAAASRELPFIIPVPVSYEKFAALVAGRTPQELTLAIQRIRVCNAPALAADSKRKLQELLGIVVQHFAILAGRSPVPLAHCNALLAPLLAMTSEVPFFATTVARTRLTRMHERLVSGLSASSNADAGEASADAAAAAASTPSQAGASSSTWPGTRSFLQLKLFATLFPVSDKRHPVTTPAALFVGQCLSQCIVNTPLDAAKGLLYCSLALHMAAPAKRFCPELLNFLTETLTAATDTPTTTTHPSSSSPNLSEDSGTLVRFAPGVLSIQSTPLPAATAQLQQKPGSIKSKPAKAVHQKVPSLSSLPCAPLNLENILNNTSSTTPSSSPAPTESLPESDAAAAAAAHSASLSFKSAVLHTAVSLLKAAVESLDAEMDGLPQILAPSMKALQSLGANKGGLPSSLKSARSELLLLVSSLSSGVLSTRKPLVQSSRLRAPPAREFNPRFEEDFAKGHDYDPDRERAEGRKLKKLHAKEKRGVMRELRRDGAFLAAEREAEKSVVDGERLDSQRKFYAELQNQQSDLRSGGQGGMNPHLQNKKARRKA